MGFYTCLSFFCILILSKCICQSKFLQGCGLAPEPKNIHLTRYYLLHILGDRINTEPDTSLAQVLFFYFVYYICNRTNSYLNNTLGYKHPQTISMLPSPILVAVFYYVNLYLVISLWGDIYFHVQKQTIVILEKNTDITAKIYRS